ncbi:hypothetical protein C8F01DRAFT_1135783 [Mycena amicta]|nr:hypothetical protein C8F01DRAFT_1135783 [Mycena amicta]
MPKTTSSTRPPNRWALYLKKEIPLWRKANPHLPHTQAMIDIGIKWRNAPENPNRGHSPIRKNRVKKNTPSN